MPSTTIEQQARILHLPEPPASEKGRVKAWEKPVVMRTWLPEPADRNPMFLERRVYQGSSGRVYPLPFIDRISDSPADHEWQAVHIENDFLRVMILPEIGGRIHVGIDKTNGFDFFYRQNVIKPALVGLAGPWISGGVEFNWPQHHRPSTFMPVQCTIARESDGSVTVWCSDHDPFTRMKGMHGVCLHPDRAYIELKVRLFNRTPFTQTFLWWANAAVRVHERYQSFFPPDVRFVADHARRAITSFPLADRPYYGVDYPERARSGVPENEIPSQFIPDGSYPPNDLSWYANIPVPTSYMVVGSEGNFMGGYDHAAAAGVVHVADHHIAPGKKQWTWGNHAFGYAWDRNLTETDGPYIELMAGVYTDNQPDFSFLAPWETKVFSQFWYPIRLIGPPQAANTAAALSLRIDAPHVHVGVCVTRDLVSARVSLTCRDRLLAEWTGDLSVRKPLQESWELPPGTELEHLKASVACKGQEILSYAPGDIHPVSSPEVAMEPALPEEVATADELYLTGLHLEQYRHATRSPEPYWREGLRRDPGDSRCNNALGLWRLRRGEFLAAEAHFRAAIGRLTRRNANPKDGEPYYNLGLALQFLGREDEAYDAFYKAVWNAAWRAPARYALAAMDARRKRWHRAADHLRECLLAEAGNLNARNLLAMVLTQLGCKRDSGAVLRETARIDPLDSWSQYLLSGSLPDDQQRLLDLAFDLAGAGFYQDSISVLQSADPTRVDGSVPMILYVLAHVHSQMGDEAAAVDTLEMAAQASPEYCFPSRLEEMLVLEWAVTANPGDGKVSYYLGNFYYDRRRYDDAIVQWERAVALIPSHPTAWRNLGIAYFNVRNDGSKAREAFERAFAADRSDGRVLYERDQLWKRTGVPADTRLVELSLYPTLCQLRDDLTLEVATLHNQLEQPEKALYILLNRRFHPWEGGEGMVLEQYTRSLLSLGERALAEDRPVQARHHFQQALVPPANLNEAKHLLANDSNVWFWIGATYADENLHAEAVRCWQRAAVRRGDFLNMALRTISPMTFWSAMAMHCAGDRNAAREVFTALLNDSIRREQESPKIDYFATSLPAMLLFTADLALQNRVEAMFLRAQAFQGLGQFNEAESLLNEVLELDRNHLAAAELLRQQSTLARLAGLK